MVGVCDCVCVDEGVPDCVIDRVPVPVADGVCVTDGVCVKLAVPVPVTDGVPDCVGDCVPETVCV